MMIGILHTIFILFRFEALKYFDKKALIEEERDKIVENLEEAIITKSGKGINFTNKFGFAIM